MANRVPKLIGEIHPRDVAGVEVISDNRERVHNPRTLQSEANHARLLPPRKVLISDAEVAIIRAAFPEWHLSDAVLPVWIRDSAILWARELIELEILRATGLHTKTDNAAAIRFLRDPDRPLPRRAVPIRNDHSSSHSAPS